MTKHYNRTSENAICCRHRRGITLVEMLVAMAITLVMMAAVVTVFDQIGQGVNDSRSTLEMSARLRNTRNRLQNDLASLTCPTQPWIRPESGLGYFEYQEGPHVDAWVDMTGNGSFDPNDRFPTSLINDVNYTDELRSQFPSITFPAGNPASLVDFSTLGDYDDILMFTVRSRGEPFVGRVTLPDGSERSIQSNVAEIIWYAAENPAAPPEGWVGEPGLRTIYRRVLLVAPWVADELSDIRDGNGNPIDPNDGFTYGTWYDVSSRVVSADTSGGQIRVPNSLSDLTKRENRFGHDRVNFPHKIVSSAIHPLNPSGFIELQPFFFSNAEHPRLGEDVMLSNVLAFDVRAFDLAAPVYQIGDSVVIPGDPGWRPLAAAPIGFGAYVDLQYAPGVTWPPGLPVPLFSGNPHLKSDLPGGPTRFPTYDTWPIHYEHDGLNQDEGWDSVDSTGPNVFDEGTDGFDTDGQNGVDDMGERETAPPYNVPLRGIEVRIRVYEPDSRQIREVMVRQSFVAE